MTKRTFALFAPALVAGFLLAGGAQAQNCSGSPNANTICAGPSSGGSGFPNFRAMVPADIPAGTVANSNLANMAGNTVKCNPTTSSGSPQDCVGFHWGPLSNAPTATFPTLATGELYYDNFNGYGENNSAFNIFNDLGASAPNAVLHGQFNLNQCQGNNSTFVGCGGLYVQTQDRSTVNSSNKGVLYGVNVALKPTVTRNNSPADDATGLLVTNIGTGTGTEAIFVGKGGSVTTDWNAGLGIAASALRGIYMAGTYTFGISFVNGSSAQFTGGGGLILAPTPGAGSVQPLFEMGTDTFAPSNDKVVLSVDAAGFLHNNANAAGSFPVTTSGIAINTNFSNANAEVDIFNSNTTATDSFRFYQQTGASAATQILTLKPSGHVAPGGTAPTNNACTGFSLATGSTDTAGKVSFTNTDTSCAINFGTAYTNAPFCTVSLGSSGTTYGVTTSTTVLTVTFSAAGPSSMFYQCFGG